MENRKDYHENVSRGTPLFPFAMYRVFRDGDTNIVRIGDRININRTVLINSYLYGGKKLVMGRNHWHDEAEFDFVVQGKVDIYVSGKLYEANPGDIIFINKGELHEMTTTDPNTGYYAYVFPLEYLSFVIGDYGDHYIQKLQEGKAAFPPIIHPDFPGYEILYREIFSIIEAMEEKYAGYELMVKASLYKIIGTLTAHKVMRMDPARSVGGSLRSGETLKKIILYCQEHYSEKIYLNEVAGEFHMSPSYFCKVVKTGLGKTFVDYLNYVRIEKASYLLLNTQEQISNIAYSVGFDNFSYFIRKFKEATGYSPREFRKKDMNVKKTK